MSEEQRQSRGFRFWRGKRAKQGEDEHKKNVYVHKRPKSRHVFDLLRERAFSFEGRIGGGQFFYRILLTYLVFFAGAAMILGSAVQDWTSGHVMATQPSMIQLGLSFALGLFSTGMWICTVVKRLHDMGRGAWWALPLFLVSMSFTGTFLVVMALWLLPGQNHENQYEYKNPEDSAERGKGLWGI